MVNAKKIKKLSKGQRTHARRMKQAARKEANPTNSPVRTTQPPVAAKNPDQS